MIVTIISDKKQQFNGKNYYCGNGRYFRRTTNPRKDGTKAKSYLLHREVWEFHNGAIPEGMQINHKDWDWRNNQIENLELVTREQNMAHQNPINTEKRRQHIENIRPLASKWHGSDAGKKFHSDLGKKSWKTRKTMMKVCENCGDAYATYLEKSRFCGGTCKMAKARSIGQYDEDRVCTMCGVVFQTYKHGPVKTCSTKCKTASAWQKRRNSIS